eukprot:15063800-Alexandrium_andersonii.AAC.1
MPSESAHEDSGISPQRRASNEGPLGLRFAEPPDSVRNTSGLRAQRLRVKTTRNSRKPCLGRRPTTGLQNSGIAELLRGIASLQPAGRPSRRHREPPVSFR